MAEFEVYGQGFVPQASFLSDPIDLGRESSLGRIWWSGQLDPEAKIVVQSRSGSDDQPEVYWRKTGVGGEEVPFGANGQPMSRKNYEAMPKNVRGGITQDLETGAYGTPMSTRTDSPASRFALPVPGSMCSYTLIFSPLEWRGDRSTRCF